MLKGKGVFVLTLLQTSPHPVLQSPTIDLTLPPPDSYAERSSEEWV